MTLQTPGHEGFDDANRFALLTGPRDMICRLLMVFLFVFAADALAAPPVLSGTVTRYGIFEMTGPARGPWTVGEVKETASIPAEQGVRFGIEFEVRGIAEPSARLSATLRHPPMTMPDGEVVTSSTNQLGPTPSVDGVVNGAFGLTFDHPYEIVPGKWVIEIGYGGIILIEKEFSVVR